MAEREPCNTRLTGHLSPQEADALQRTITAPVGRGEGSGRRKATDYVTSVEGKPVFIEVAGSPEDIPINQRR